MDEALRVVDADSETVSLQEMRSEAIDVLKGSNSPYEAPVWVQRFQSNPQRIEFVGKEGSDKLERWRSHSEERIESLLQKKQWSVLHAMAILRRLPTDRFFLGEREAENAVRYFDPYQAAVTERAALKYANWSDEGVETESWQPGSVDLVWDKPIVSPERLADIWALHDNAGVKLALVDNVRKTLVRGGQPILHQDGVVDTRPEPGLRRRLDLEEKRKKEFSFTGATVNSFHPEDVRPAYNKFMAYAARTSFREDEGEKLWRYEDFKVSLPQWDRRFELISVSLDPLYEYMKLVEGEVQLQYGLTPEQIVAALSAVSRFVDRFLASDTMSEEVRAERRIYIEKRGYLLVSENVMDDIVFGQYARESFEESFPNFPWPNDHSKFICGFKRLSYLDSYRREDLDLVDGLPWMQRFGDDELIPMPPPFIYPAGPYRILDLGALGDFVDGLRDCLVLRDNKVNKSRKRVSTDLEQRLGDYFEKNVQHERAFRPLIKLLAKVPGQSKSRSVAQLDASIKVGSVLVAIDAKFIQVSPKYLRYQHAALKGRWNKFEDYVKDADEQADKLARQPKGTNYDLVAAGYTHIVTLLCSATVEYIDTDSENFYIRRSLPRVATPQELRDFLNETTADELKSLPFAKQIGN